MLKRTHDRSSSHRGRGRWKQLPLTSEHYLRDDVPCRSMLCVHGCQSIESQSSNYARLSDALSHYCLPDPCSLALYGEALLEEPIVQGLILTQTSYQYLQRHGSRAQFKQAQQAVSDPRSGHVLFSNEFCSSLWRERRHDQTEDQYLFELVYDTAVWYRNHLNGIIPLVIITCSADYAAAYGNRTEGVLVLQVRDYVDKFDPNVRSLHARMEALEAAQAERAEVEANTGTASVHGYVEHLTTAAIMAGVKSGLYIQGKLNVDRSGHNAYVQAAATEEADLVLQADVVVQGHALRNRAIHGDVVAVVVLSSDQWPSATRRAGRVVGIVDKRWRDTVVTLQEGEVDIKGSKALTIPMDPRLPKIRIATSNKAALMDQRLVVRVDDWPVDSMHPNGHLVRSLGVIGDLDTETAAMLIENTISAPPFTPAQLAEMPINTPEQPWHPSDVEAQRRRDLRNSHFIFSIDPLGCEDVDDTLCVRQLRNNMVELSVHIADVSHFVRPGMLTNAEASSRGTTIYLADRRYDMLPAVLSADLCSLHDQVERYAMSVIWTIDEQGQVVDTWFGRTLIRSAYKLHYELAQALFDGLPMDQAIAQVPNLKGLPRSEQEARVERLRAAVSLLIETSRRLKSQRTDAGGLQLESDEIRVKLDKHHSTVQELLPKTELEIHGVVAECMIYANRAVAERIATVFPSRAILRRHPLPDKPQFAELHALASAAGVTIDTSSNKALAESLDVAGQAGGTELDKMLRLVATQAMTEAEYFNTGDVAANDWFHYGLGLEQYTHFTSPIRRYADVLAHRLLMASLVIQPNKGDQPFEPEYAQRLLAEAPTATELTAICANINVRNRCSKAVQRDSLAFFQALYFKQQSHKTTAVANILNLREGGILVYLPDFGLKDYVTFPREDDAFALPGAVFGIEGDSTIRCSTTLNDDGLRLIPLDASLGPVLLRTLETVMVEIAVHETRYRQPRPRCQLMALAKASSSVQLTTNQAKAKLVQSVKETMGAKVQLKPIASMPATADSSTSDSNLYGMLQAFESMAVSLDDDLD
eukprot:TRINITY_DN12453_c0_g5_i17.p1 TRINITY_DN12453_c0_g5~~TRINITY_DN12453_c0_g5_i17.p1  ORF type:complete len:1043 (+),score=227.73 TRINITY_DN12453_c0_g5_i17:1776-4904(+)